MSDEPESGNITAKTSTTAVNEALAQRQKLVPCVIVLAGANVGETHKLEGGDLVLGRGMNANIRLRDDGVSRRHARIVLDGGEVAIEDLDSANGTIVNSELVRRRVLHDGDKIRLGATTILKFTYHDTVEERFQQQMYDAALRDGLTRAFNRKYFLDRLEGEFAYAQRHKTTLAVVMFDVDHFKKVNDTHGHLAGDHVLARLAEIARACIRAEDVFARWGGEEFAILCRGIPLAHAAILGERLRARVEAARFEHEGVSMTVTISVGIAGLPETEVEGASALVAAADEALYRAKDGGRNRVIMAGT